MAQYEDEALILSVRNFGEADKMVTFFSRNFGKGMAVAYGCRRPRSPLAGGMQVFSHLNLQVMSGRNLDTIKQCDTKQTFKKLREDLECMAYAAFLTELVTELCPEKQPEMRIYDLLLMAFATFEKRNPRLVALIAAFQILECTGYQPSYDSCVRCGKVLEDQNPAFFSEAAGGILCETCGLSGQTTELSAKVRCFIKQALVFDWQEEADFRINGAVLVKTEALLLQYLLYVLERPLKSLVFIGQLARLPKHKDKLDV